MFFAVSSGPGFAWTTVQAAPGGGPTLAPRRIAADTLRDPPFPDHQASTMPAVRPGTALALLPLVMAMLLPLAAGNILPGPVVVNVGGVDYKVTTVHCNQLVHCNNIIPTSAAWGDESLSQQLAVAVDASLGSGPLYTTPTNYGPLFVWTYAFNHVAGAWYYSFCSMMFGATAQDTCNSIDQYFAAYIAMAMALPSSPGALDCGAATFAPALLESRLDGQICAAYKVQGGWRPGGLAAAGQRGCRTAPLHLATP